MADTVGFFQLVDPKRAEFLGPFTAKNAAEIKTGLLVEIGNDGTLTLATAVSDKEMIGYALTNRTLVYAPTTVFAAAGEQVTVVRGHVQFVTDYSFFSGATDFPATGASIYTAPNGLMDISGGVHIGRVIMGKAAGLDTRTPPNTTSTLVLCEAHLAAD